VGVTGQAGWIVGQSEGRGPAADAEIGGQEDIRVAERPQGHVLGGPRPDAGDLDQPGLGLGPVRAGIEHQPPVRDGGRERPQGPSPGGRHAERLVRCFGHLGRG
jgi:hypothetical protein